MTEGSAFYPVFPALKDYSWGSNDPDGAIGDILRKNTEGEIPPGPYAELWYGDHPSGPSLLPDGSNLREQIEREKGHILGSEFADGGKLPYLLKILESQSPLSIQAHPDLDLARRLHDSDPDHYPDANHKPEIAICLRPGFGAMAGFRSANELIAQLKQYPELNDVLPGLQAASNGNARDALKSAFAALYRMPGNSLAAISQKLYQRIQKSPQEGRTGTEIYFLRFCDLYGFEDPGVFSIFLMNLVQFRPGESLFMGAREPHAYLQGSIIECMACSDNVVRGGLTSKFVDVDTLVEMLHYRMGPPDRIEPQHIGGTVRYVPPVSDFQVWTADFDRDSNPLQLPLEIFPAMAVSLSGQVEIQQAQNSFSLQPGRAVLLPRGPAEKDGPFTIVPSGKAKLVISGPGPKQPTNL
ncbi:MAG: mannose-6-phosphate isomerase, class I [Leptospiraceae bacterium]|nr:mannose-6-phosphate isomerase, class I [Leptospiraceae bacterium]